MKVFRRRRIFDMEFWILIKLVASAASRGEEPANANSQPVTRNPYHVTRNGIRSCLSAAGSFLSGLLYLYP